MNFTFEGRYCYLVVFPAFLFILASCAHQGHSEKNNRKIKGQIVSDSPVKSVYSASIEKEPSQAIVDKLLDDGLEDNSDTESLDSDNSVASEDTKYNEQDQAEDVVEKLLAEKTSDDAEVDTSSSEKPFIEIKNHPLVHKWINFFTKTDRGRFIRFMTNGAKYRSIIEKIFDEEGVPRDLFFVGMIESGFFLKAKSHANATGPWQFIRATGKRYGLIVSRTLDERKDLYKSTRAAARYFRDLYKIFGSWELAMSAYNAGEFGIMRRIKRAKTENFFSLATRGYLLPETANYVPKVMAVIHIYQNLQRYGFEPIEVENPFEKSVKIKLKHSHSLRLIANTLDIPLETLEFLNSELSTPYTPYLKNGFYQLRVPSEAWLNRGQDLIAVLRQTHSRTPSSTLARYEQETDSRTFLRTIKNRPRSQKISLTFSKNLNLIKTNQPLLYTVQDGDNLTSIAKKFKVTHKAIAKINKLARNQVMKGQKIKIPGTLRTYYQVKRGDNLHSIARKFNLTPNFLKQLNDLSAGDIYTGQKLLVLL